MDTKLEDIVGALLVFPALASFEKGDCDHADEVDAHNGDCHANDQASINGLFPVILCVVVHH